MIQNSFSIKFIIFVVFIAIFSCTYNNNHQHSIHENNVIPSAIQVEYQQMELIGFIHFTVNTFTNKEWGFGDEDPNIFNPTEMDVEQWVIAAKEGGMKELILTAKHHDGFCLWPSKYTEHSVKNSPYKNGNGDIVKEFVEACRKHGLKVGLYLSPWDRNHKDYSKPEYLIYYKNQITELLTQYGNINEIWFDGANGGDGYYGGANETRRIDSQTYYNWDDIFALVKELQPNIKIFSDAGPDIRWIGNENGYAGSTFWSTINKDSIIIGNSNPDYLNTGEEGGNNWIIGQCDVSIRPGWFYHKTEDSLVKTPQELVDIYYKSVGRNSVLLINLPPNKKGLIHNNDINSLKVFKQILDSTFANNLAAGALCSTINYRLDDIAFSPNNIVDDNKETYWATDELTLPAEVSIELKEEQLFDRILIQEPVRFGQRISKFRIEILLNNNWESIFEGTTIGYKRLIRIPPVSASKIKLTVTDANNTVAISNFGVFKASEEKDTNFIIQ